EVSTLTRSTVSHHLKILREAEVLSSEKIGKEVWFWINRGYLEKVLGSVLDYVRESA
ncbi:MAG: helix-turn-helix transcriptional regulator, partial [Betaproteobacteria bacterium]|nr:helix-turn-helix transcriptional regulator [Betaproteobacteria bacterium]